MTSMDSLSYETPINLSGVASAKVAYKAGICMLLRRAVHVRPQRRSAGRGLALRLRQGQRQESSAPLPLPVHQGRGGWALRWPTPAAIAPCWKPPMA